MNEEPTLTVDQAYEAAVRFVAQYYAREPDSESLLLMLVAMTPVADHYQTNDPASWTDWQDCVRQTLEHAPLQLPLGSSDS